jgi:hypothetical protein
VKIFFRVGAGAVNYFVDYDNSTDFLKSRRKFVSQIGLAQYLYIFDLWFMVNTYSGIKQRIFFPDLPRHLMVLPSLKSQIYTDFDNPDKIKYN